MPTQRRAQVSPKAEGRCLVFDDETRRAKGLKLFCRCGPRACAAHVWGAPPLARRPRVGFARVGLVRVGLALGLALLGLEGCVLDPAGESACALAAGDLVITEVMANPAGPDTGKEWIELFNATDAPIDLRGVRLVAGPVDGSSDRSFMFRDDILAPGALWVVGDAPAGALPAYIDASYGRALGALRNGEGRVELRCGAEVVDEIVYGSTREGRSLLRSGAGIPGVPVGPAHFLCFAEAHEYEPGQLGTPGAPNERCGDGVLPPDGHGGDGGSGGGGGGCLDDHGARPLDPPVPGDLVIAEVMADPDAVPDAQGEWFELWVARDLDLNGLELGTEPTRGPRQIISSAECLRVTAGTHVLFARSMRADENGGLPEVDLRFSFALPNTNGSIFVGHGGVVLDEVAYGRPTPGVALALDPQHHEPPEPLESGRTYCNATEPYGLGDRGTPGALNPSCEPVDLPGGCEVDAGSLEPPGPSNLFIAEVMVDPDAVPDARGEWFELYATRDLNLAGLELRLEEGGEPRQRLSAPNACLPVMAGTRLLFARSDDPALNGGLPDVDFTFGFSLVNRNGQLLLGYGGNVIDEVTWSTVTAGAARSRDGEGLWCDASEAYGLGDLGTPAAPNPPCEL